MLIFIPNCTRNHAITIVNCFHHSLEVFNKHCNIACNSTDAEFEFGETDAVVCIFIFPDMNIIFLGLFPSCLNRENKEIAVHTEVPIT